MQIIYAKTKLSPRSCTHECRTCFSDLFTRNTSSPNNHVPKMQMHVVRAVWLARIYCGCASVHLHLHIRVRALPFLFHRKARALGYLLQGHNKTQREFVSKLHNHQDKCLWIICQATVLGRRCSPLVSLGCFVMAVKVLLWGWNRTDRRVFQSVI